MRRLDSIEQLEDKTIVVAGMSEGIALFVTETNEYFAIRPGFEKPVLEVEDRYSASAIAYNLELDKFVFD